MGILSILFMVIAIILACIGLGTLNDACLIAAGVLESLSIIFVIIHTLNSYERKKK